MTRINNIQLIITNIIQSNYTLSNKNNGADMMFLFNTGLSRLTNKLSLISNKNLLVIWAKIVKSSNKVSWLQIRRCSSIDLTTLLLKNLMGKCRCVLQPLLSSTCQFHHNRKHCIFHTEIYTQNKTQSRKENVRDISFISENYLTFTKT